MTDWPTFPVPGWAETRPTLHRWTQILGKIRLALASTGQPFLAQHAVRVDAWHHHVAHSIRLGPVRDQP